MSLCDNVIMKFCVFFMLLMGVFGNGSAKYENSLYKDAVRLVNECGSKSISLCFKEKALKYIERLPNNFDIGNGIRVKQTDAARLSRKHTPITLPNETTAREATLNSVLLERITEYFRSHTLEFKMPLAAVTDMQMPMEEGRGKGEGGGGGGYGGGGGGGGGKGGKGGKKGSMMPLLMMFHFKAATMGAMAIKLIGMVAFKALLVAKIALTIALAVAAKKLFEQKHHTQTYEVVAHPQVVHDDYGHHDRSYVQDLAYRAHRNGS